MKLTVHRKLNENSFETNLVLISLNTAHVRVPLELIEVFKILFHCYIQNLEYDEILE